jgi:hypothetical protein
MPSCSDGSQLRLFQFTNEKFPDVIRVLRPSNFTQITKILHILLRTCNYVLPNWSLIEHSG